MGKKKKEKIRYIDDGRILADMSSVKSGFRIPDRNPNRPKVDPRDAWKTYWNAVKMMFVPMLVVVVAICIIYMIFYALLTLL